jgi:hypothetical protein
MLKNILKIEGAQKLNKNEQEKIIGAGNNGPYEFVVCCPEDNNIAYPYPDCRYIECSR